MRVTDITMDIDNPELETHESMIACWPENGTMYKDPTSRTIVGASVDNRARPRLRKG